MKPAISNIAWLPGERADVYRLLADRGVHGIEIAPSLLFPDASRGLTPDHHAIAAVLAEAKSYGHRFVSMQSIHFGIEGAQLFGAPDERERFIGALMEAVDLAGELGIGNIVVGSPKNRAYPPEWSSDEVAEKAAEFLTPLGDAAAAKGVSIALEPNPHCYGTNFVNTIDAAVDLAARLDHPAIGVNFDLGERLFTNDGATVATDVAQSASLIRHTHVSAPELLPPIGRETAIDAMCRSLAGAGYDRWVSIEMRRDAARPLETIDTIVSSLLAALERAD